MGSEHMRKQKKRRQRCIGRRQTTIKGMIYKDSEFYSESFRRLSEDFKKHNGLKNNKHT